MKIEHVAIVGAGIMGGHIAAFFANLGIKSDLYDIDRAIAEKTLQKISDPNSKMPVLYTPRFVKRIQPRLISEMEKYLKNADMIIEAVPEKMEIKHKVFTEVDKHRRSDAIVATNTSGLSINAMSRVMSESMARYFLGTHYFNPVRYMPLVEIILSDKSDPKIAEFLIQFYETVGKKPLICKDTTNFIANRIGIFSLMKSISMMDRYRFDVEMIDLITGPPLGNPNTATLRLCDMVGLDTAVEVARNVYLNCPLDEVRDIFKPCAWLERMVQEKMLGEKTGKGFYQKSGDKILTLDIEKWLYRPQNKVKLDIVGAAKEYENAGDRVRVMCQGDNTASRFCRELVLATASYSLHRLGEITDDIAAIDNALKWGFRREIGPIEVLDYIGLERAREWMQEFVIPIPPVLDDIIAKGSVYKSEAGKNYCFAPKAKDFTPLPSAHYVSLEILKQSGKVVRANLSTRLIDLGDSVLLLELDHKMVPTMNPVDEFVIRMMNQVPQVMKEEGFKALVIGNQADNFCAGAQLQMVLEACKEKAWKKIEEMCFSFEKANTDLYHAGFPVVVAPHGMSLGGGMEITLSGHRRVVLSEFYGGLVEVGVGLLPGGGGNLLLLLQFLETMEAANPGPVYPMMKAFELIAYGTVSTSAYDAMDKGIIRQSDHVVYNKDEQIQRAKEVALGMIAGHTAKPLRELYLPGNSGYLVIDAQVDDLVVAGKLTPHGALIARKQAYVLTGGDKASPVEPVSEEYILELEREAFVSLCGEEKSQDRIAYMLKNKKPLFN
jgi:3-hydroxyacyl-CoA dehydrogenase